jgi:hypothetical protein
MTWPTALIVVLLGVYFYGPRIIAWLLWRVPPRDFDRVIRGKRAFDDQEAGR